MRPIFIDEGINSALIFILNLNLLNFFKGKGIKRNEWKKYL